MLIDGDVNALNLFDLRKLKYAPPHFKSVYISADKNIKEIDLWIYLHSSCRYTCRKTNICKNNEIVDSIEIAFEDSNQLTLFLLSCPLI